jgi:NADP-dependent 3-hydroxy acid dehydrogenase YdfG
MGSSAELSGRRVVVAGGSGGIGLAVARRLAEAGAELILVARRPGPLEAAAREVGAMAVAGDVTDRGFVAELKAQVDRGGTPDALINAGGAFDLASVASTDPDMFDRMVAANLTGPFLLIRAFLPDMLGAGRGHIVTVGSVAGRVAFPGNGAYSASKFGIRGLHAVLDQELKGTGVRCTLIDPAATDTTIWDPLDPDRRADLPSREAMLSPAAVADAVHYVMTRPPDVQIPAVSVQRS